MRFALGRDLVLVALERSVAVAARMIRNRNRDAPDVVRVVALGELVALSGRRILHARTVAFLVGSVRRVHVNFYDVCPRRNLGLMISAIEDEILTRQLEHVGISPAGTDALISVGGGGAAAPVFPRAVTVLDVVR